MFETLYTGSLYSTQIHYCTTVNVTAKGIADKIMIPVYDKSAPAPILKQVADLWCLYASSRSPCSSCSNADYSKMRRRENGREREGNGRKGKFEGSRKSMIVQNIMHVYMYLSSKVKANTSTQQSKWVAAD